GRVGLHWTLLAGFGATRHRSFTNLLTDKTVNKLACQGRARGFLSRWRAAPPDYEAGLISRRRNDVVGPMADRQELPLENPRRNAEAMRIGVAAALALTLLSACGPKPAAQAEPPPSPVAAAKPVLSSNLDQIQNQYAAEPAAARSKFEKNAV